MLIDTIRKKMKVIIWFIVIAFVLSIFFVGAAGFLDNWSATQTRPVQGRADDNMPDQLSGLRSEKPVALVRHSSLDATVTEGQFQRFVLESGVMERLKNLPPAFHKYMMQQVMDQLVSEKLMYLEGSSQKMSVSSQVMTQIDSFKQRAGSPEAFEQFLKSNGFANEAEFVAYLEPKMMAEAVSMQLFRSVEVGQDEIELYYKLNEDQFKRNDGTVEPLSQVQELIRMELASKVSDEELLAYYEKHKARWQKPLVMDLELLYLSATDPKDLNSVRASVSESMILDFYNKNTRRFMSAERAEVAHLFLSRDELSQKLNADDSELLKYYTERPQNYMQSEEVKASHILLRFADHKTETETLDKAEFVKQKILVDGMDFAEAARQFSADPGSKEQGGDLGFFPRGMMVPSFEEYAFTGPIGVVSEPVRTEYGYHLIRVEEKNEAGVKAFDLVKEQVLKDFQSEMVGAQADKILDDALALIRQKKRSFEQLVQELSHAPSKDKQGVVGIVFLGEGNDDSQIKELSSGGVGMDEPVLTALKRLKAGEVSDLVETRQGFHLLKVNRKLDRVQLPLEKVKDGIREDLVKQVIKAHYESRKSSVNEAVKKGAEISTLMEKYQDLKSNLSGRPLSGLIVSSDVEQSVEIQSLLGETLLYSGRLDTPVIDGIRYLKPSMPVTAVELEDATVFVKVKAIKDAEFSPFSEVKEEIRQDITLKVNVSEIEAAYAQDPQKYIQRGKLVIQQLVYQSESVAREQAKIINSGGLKFEDAGRSSLNLDKGSFNRNDGKIELSDASFFDQNAQEKIRALNPGEMNLEPIRSNFGWHIVKMVEKSEDKSRTLEEVRNEILQEIQNRRRSEVVSKFITELRNKAELIQIYTENR
ncbi:MAG: peptidylprolyl isomerase [Candidatus Cloacimonetes bacterium]|nr:peptidylprolyl isomerase [Candidatus Cloacimonadota bacterium]